MKLYPKQEAAEYLHIGMSTLNALIARGCIAYFKNPGSKGRVLFSEEHLDQYLESVKVETIRASPAGHRKAINTQANSAQ